MYNQRSYRSGFQLPKSKSVGNFYQQATQRSLKYQSSLPSTGNDCLACKHQRQKVTSKLKQPSLDPPSLYLDRKNTQEEYYKKADNNQLLHIRKSKRYLQQLLERTKRDFKTTVDTYQKKLTQVTQELQDKKIQLNQVQMKQHQKDAQQYYLNNASIVQSYKQKITRNEQQDQIRINKIKELVRKNEYLQEELRLANVSNRQKRQKIELYEIELSKAKEYQYYAQQYEAMKALIDKMQQQKFQLLDRQHSQLQQLGMRYQQQKASLDQKLQEVRSTLNTRNTQLQSKQHELDKIKQDYQLFRDEQYEALRQLLSERDQELLQLESRLNCVNSELNFIKNKYGYLLRLAQGGKLQESGFQSEADEYCLQRIGRYQLSNGKESLMSMNLSPIKHR